MNAENQEPPIPEGPAQEQAEAPPVVALVLQHLAEQTAAQWSIAALIWASLDADSQQWYLQAQSGRQQEAEARERLGIAMPVGITDARKSTIPMATPDGRTIEVTRCMVARPKVPEPTKGE